MDDVTVKISMMLFLLFILCMVYTMVLKYEMFGIIYPPTTDFMDSDTYGDEEDTEF
jgi:hypothetical protein